MDTKGFFVSLFLATQGTKQIAAKIHAHEMAATRLRKEVLERGVNFKLPYGRGSSARITQSLDKPSGNPTTLLWQQFSS